MTPLTSSTSSSTMYRHHSLTAIVILAVVSNRTVPVLGADILAFFPLPIYSHFSGFNHLFLELANRGHRVTVVSPFSPKRTDHVPSTYIHVPVPDVKIQRSRNPLDVRNVYRVTNMISVKRNIMNMVRRTLELKETREFLNDTKYAFDLVLSECWYSDIYLAVGHRYSTPVVCLSPMMPSTTLGSSLGVPINPAYVPSFWLRYSDIMSFAERLYNAAIAYAEVLLSDVVLRKAEQEMLQDLYSYPGHRDCPSLDELRETVSLTLVNSHYSVSYARPYPPNVVSVAGMHVLAKSSANIDPEFKRLIDGATDGVIYFSFGSNIKTADLPEREVRAFVESFRKLRQIVLWKWETGTIDNLPDNVHVDKWFPQQFILSHRNCKLFITHGGYHSLVEALHFGLAVIGFPFYTDQFYNMRFVVENGFGIEILLNDLQVDVLDDAIGKVLLDTSYKKNAQKASEIFLDLPVSALDTAVYWVEYVVRNGRDYKSPQTHGLNWYQYFLLDVIVLIVSCLILTSLIVYKSAKRLNKTFNHLRAKHLVKPKETKRIL